MKKDSPAYLAIFLAVVAAIAGGALSFANSMTAPVIKSNDEKAEKASLLEMYPEASVDDCQGRRYRRHHTGQPGSRRRLHLMKEILSSSSAL